MRNVAVVLVAPCVMNAALQAGERNESEHWGATFSQLLAQADIMPFLLPCPETKFCGLPRKQHGIDFYENLDGYVEHCRQAAQEAAKQVYQLHQNGCEIIACLGIEHSPSCAVSYMYSRRGTLKRQGIFFDFLFDNLNGIGISLDRIGINRKHPKKAHDNLSSAISKWKATAPPIKMRG